MQGAGNLEFNNGQKSKFAYRIDDIYELENGISLKELKEDYGFVPPQAFAYDDRYPNLTRKLDQEKKIKGSEKMKYKLNLNNRAFDAIKAGTKKIEIRVTTDKNKINYENIKKGDVLEFTNEK